MRIVLRTSGGRGEYEIAGSQGDYKLNDLLEKRLFLEVIPGKLTDTGAALMRRDGKPRIRLIEKWGKHIYLILSSVLLLPKPIRELGKTAIINNRLEIRDGAYSITAIDFAISTISDNWVHIRPTRMVLQNCNQDTSSIDVVERLHSILAIWEKVRSNKLPQKEVAYLLRNHEEAVLSGNIEKLEDVANAIRKYVSGSEEEPLTHLIHILNIKDTAPYGCIQRGDIIDFIEEDKRKPEEINAEIIKKWRSIAVRGRSGEEFKKTINMAYNSTCLFTGMRLPSTELNAIPGVDAAHILPWAMHNNNHITNGICLNKLCHWAFDSGIIRLEFDDIYNEYLIKIPERYQRLHHLEKMDLSYFIDIQGIIPKRNLPGNQKFWPSPTFIQEFNKTFV